MNAETLLSAIGGISDKHIVEFAVVKQFPAKKPWVVVLSLAACLAIVICVLKLGFFTRNQVIDTVPKTTVCSIDGAIYELVKDEKIIRSKGLPDTITDDMLGTYIGSWESETSNLNGEAYDYLGYHGNSVLIAELDSQHYYLVFCNLQDSNAPIKMLDLLERYGLKDNISSIRIDGKEVKSNYEQMYDAIVNTRALSGDEFNNLIFAEKTEEEQLSIMDNMAKERTDIAISGNSADTLILSYYPSLGYAFASNTYFEIKPELKQLLID